MSWFSTNRRYFPWREADRSCYELTIAEILLQKTQAEKVAKVYNNFLVRFDSWESIEKSPIEEIARYLKPLGLWRKRSEGLKALAHALCANNEKLPETYKELTSFPMIGQYVANALLVQCFNQKKPFLDVNMSRVLGRFFGTETLIDSRQDEHLLELSEKVINKRKIEDVKTINWAILDFGSKVCRSHLPKCDQCVLQKECAYYRTISTLSN